MSLAEMKKATGDAVFDADQYRVFVPSMGATYDRDRGVPDGEPFNGYVHFIVSASQFPNLHFSGSVLGGPSFAGGPVTREQIIGSFGEPRTHIQSFFPSTNNNITYWRCMKTETNFSQRHNSGAPNQQLNHESLYYRDKGLRFDLKDDIVIGVSVYEVWTGQTTWADVMLKMEKEGREDPTTPPAVQ